MSDHETSSGSFWARCAGATPRNRRNTTTLLWACLVWAIVFVGSSQLIKRGILPAGPIPWVVAALPLIAGIFVLMAYGRLLREADELERVIHLEALALGFAGGWISVFSYQILERLGALTADIADAMVPLAIFYAIGIVRGSWRYR